MPLRRKSRLTWNWKGPERCASTYFDCPSANITSSCSWGGASTSSIYKIGFAGNKPVSGESFGNIPVKVFLRLLFGNYGLCFGLKCVTCQIALISFTEESNLTQLSSAFLNILLIILTFEGLPVSHRLRACVHFTRYCLYIFRDLFFPRNFLPLNLTLFPPAASLPNTSFPLHSAQSHRFLLRWVDPFHYQRSAVAPGSHKSISSQLAKVFVAAVWYRQWHLPWKSRGLNGNREEPV